MLNQSQTNQETYQQNLALINQAITDAELPRDLVQELADWAQRVMQDPQQWSNMRQWLLDRGLSAEEVSEKPNFQELAGMVAMGAALANQQPQTQTQQPQQTGPVDPAALAAQGTHGDTMLAHINPQEAAVLRSMGGSETINPNTGLPQYGFISKVWREVKSTVKSVAPYIVPVVAVFNPALFATVGGFLGASGAAASAVGAAAISAGASLASGQDFKTALTQGAISGLGAYLAPTVGRYASNVLGVTDPTLVSALGSAGISAGFAALRGESVSNILEAAATGAATSYLVNAAQSAIDSGRLRLPNLNQSWRSTTAQERFNNATTAAADARLLADNGANLDQIQRILTSQGVGQGEASSLASLAMDGASVEDMIVQLSNDFGGVEYSGGASGIDRSIIAGNNVDSLERVQALEDAQFVMRDAVSLRAAGLKSADIQMNLEAAGVSPDIANQAARIASANFTADNAQLAITGTDLGQLQRLESITSSILNLSAPANGPVRQIIGEPAQGQPQRSLGGATLEELQSQSLAQDLEPTADMVPDTGAPTQITPQAPPQIVLAPPAPAPAPAPDPRTIQAGGVAYTPEQYQDLLNAYDFAARDAAQLAAQGGANGLSAQQIQQILAYSGVDPDIAQTLAGAVSQGADAGQAAAQAAQQWGWSRSIYGNAAQNLQDTVPDTTPGAVAPEPGWTDDTQIELDLPDLVLDTGAPTQITPQEPPGLGTGIDVSLPENPRLPDMGGAQGITAPVAPSLPDMGGGQGIVVPGITPPATPPLSLQPTAPVDPGQIVVADQESGSVVQPPATPRPLYDYTFTPAPPDPSWSEPLVQPGLNPGIVGAGIRPAYPGGAPGQAQYYWGRQPFFNTPQDLANYNASPVMPAQPWGYQPPAPVVPQTWPPLSENLFPGTELNPGWLRGTGTPGQPWQPQTWDISPQTWQFTTQG